MTNFWQRKAFTIISTGWVDVYYLWAVLPVLIALILHFAIAVIPCLILSAVGLKKTAQSWLFTNNRVISRFILFLLGVKLNIEISPESEKIIKSDKGVCFVSNHTSFLDILAILIGTRAKMGFVAKNEIKFYPFVNLVAMAMHCVFIDRSDVRKSVKAIKRGSALIKDGNSLLVFPEGTRSTTGIVAPFKKGAFRLAIDSDSTVIPIAVSGLRQAFEDRKKSFGQFYAKVIILEPIKFSASDERAERFEKIEFAESEIKCHTKES